MSAFKNQTATKLAKSAFTLRNVSLPLISQPHVITPGGTPWQWPSIRHIIAERRTVGTLTENTSYTNNVDGSLASVTYPSGRVINYTYNNAQQEVSVVDATGSTNYVTGATYAPHGELASAVHGQVNGGFAV